MTQQERSDIAIQVRPFEFAIGRLVMNFGTLELSVLRGIAELLPLSPTQDLGEKVPKSFRPAVEKYQKLARRAVPALTAEAAHRGLIAELLEFAEQRNEYVHGPWFDMPGTDIDQTKGKMSREETLLELRQGVKAGRGVTPHEIIEFSNRVLDLRQRFDERRAFIVSASSKKQQAVQPHQDL